MCVLMMMGAASVAYVQARYGTRAKVCCCLHLMQWGQQAPSSFASTQKGCCMTQAPPGKDFTGTDAKAQLSHSCRWDRERPPTVDNLVLLSFGEAEQHEGMSLEDVRAADPVFYQRVQKTLARIRYELGDTTGQKT